MLLALEVSTVLLVTLAMSLALAHALELPGKLRLDERTHLSVQTIYYPGFTIGGAAEPLAVVTTLAVLFVTPTGQVKFWLILIAFFGLVGMQIVFWLVTQPTNQFWLRSERLGTAGARFFSIDRSKQVGEENGPTDNWQRLRNRWQYSHVVRAVFSAASLVTLVIAVAKWIIVAFSQAESLFVSDSSSELWIQGFSLSG